MTFADQAVEALDSAFLNTSPERAAQVIEAAKVYALLDLAAALRGEATDD